MAVGYFLKNKTNKNLIPPEKKNAPHVYNHLT